MDNYDYLFVLEDIGNLLEIALWGRDDQGFTVTVHFDKVDDADRFTDLLDKFKRLTT